MVLLALQGVLVLVCASVAVAQTADSCEEPVSLLQIDQQSQQRARRKVSASKDDACQCLNWKETYASGLVQCGQGFEYTRFLGYPVANYSTPEDWLGQVQNQLMRDVLFSLMGQEFCTSFYEAFDDNKCARAAMDSSDTEWYGKSWCYVSSACSSAMSTSSPQVSAKFCQEGTDSLLSDMAPAELFKYGKHMGIPVPMYFVKVAYPLVRQFYWDDHAQHEAEVAKLMASGRPVVVDETDEHQDKIIIYGKAVYRVEPRDVQPFSNYVHLQCVENCTEASTRI